MFFPKKYYSIIHILGTSSVSLDLLHQHSGPDRCFGKTTGKATGGNWQTTGGTKEKKSFSQKSGWGALRVPILGGLALVRTVLRIAVS